MFTRNEPSMNSSIGRRTFLTAASAPFAIPRFFLGAETGRGVPGPQLVVVSALGADHPLMQSFVSQLLEQGIWFDVDHEQQLYDRLPDDFERYRTVVFDTPAAEAVLGEAALRKRLDEFARDGGFAFRLESPPAGEGSAVPSKLLLDLTTQHRVSDIVAQANLTRQHPGLREIQLGRPVDRMIDEMKQALLARLASKKWSEYRLHEWKASLALIDAGHDDMREILAGAVRRTCREVPPPAHHDHVAAYFGAAWLAEEFEDREPLARVAARLDEMLERRPRTMGIASGYGFTDDPLRLAEAEATGKKDAAFMHTAMRRDTIWTEMLHMHAAPMASLARVTGQPRYRDEIVRLIEHVRRCHLRPDGLLAHSTRDGIPIAPAWARGQSHALYGLVYTMEELADDDPARATIIDLLDKVGRGLLAHQDAATGLWRNLIDQPDSRLESSGSTGIVYTYARAVREGWLPRDRYESMLRQAWDGLRSLYWRGGLAANCRGTGVGVEPSYYLARPQGWAWMPHLILAAVEMQSSDNP